MPLREWRTAGNLRTPPSLQAATALGLTFIGRPITMSISSIIMIYKTHATGARITIHRDKLYRTRSGPNPCCTA
uniref:Uncharacterized protein n=1 Tax=mine drainage metagenome TaxID=410659 RepID=E6Q9K2_9ZZZZ